ncbi:outer membrane protein assembly factor BamB family protein [Profundibacterium mesophilum]|uniref:Alcohol dehydrogenase n=1 Tax=Profundibacterium mesophilum KAUST100406-0324 TaxID=1037889 RepID=A0A921NNC9_9RHOB|nr:PQQ-binding-like beta-propeller repeat protein [Profundibacterium mesophilum]KAF0674826.1 alcohol dehydrogenase [Profundibacterium mesophilum KAUST100406-0324]
MTIKPALIAAILGSLAAGCTEPELILSGERLTVDGERPAASSVDRALPITLPPAVDIASWTHRAGGPAHAQGHAAFSATPRLVWSTPIGQGEGRKHHITADPAIDAGRIFTVDSRARVMAHDLAGRRLWSADLTPAGERTDDASGAGLAVSGGKLFVSTGFAGLAALDVATGAELWRQDLDATATGAPTVANDLVYVVTRDARALAIDTADGRVRWSFTGTPSEAGVVNGAAPAIAEGYAVFPFSSTEIIAALPVGGTRVWKGHVAGNRPEPTYASITDITGDPVIKGNTVYAGNPSGRIAAFDLSSGTQLWEAREGAMSPPLVSGGSLFAATDQAELIRLDAATGERIWSNPLPYFESPLPKRREAVYAHYGPILAGGLLWIASSDGYLRGADPVSGRILRRLELPSGASTNPVVAGRTLYVVSQAGQLLAFR